MVTVDLGKFDADRRNPDFGYLFYGDAKASGIKKGVTFADAACGQKFEAIEYVDFRADINRPFKGFRCKLI